MTPIYGAVVFRSIKHRRKRKNKTNFIGNRDYYGEVEDENYADDLGKSADSGLDFGSSSHFG